MPFNTNNVDMTVNANSLFGLNSLLTTLPIDEANNLFDEGLKGIYKNVTSLLSYGISSGIVLERPDLALTYYPSEYDFYWFVGRNIHLLANAKLASKNNTLPFPELEECLKTLSSIMTKVGFNQLLNLAKSDGTANNRIYWEGFLGNYGNETRHEDRLFSTAVTLNTLLDSFTVTLPNRKSRQWTKDASPAVKTAIQHAINFLV